MSRARRRARFQRFSIELGPPLAFAIALALAIAAPARALAEASIGEARAAGAEAAGPAGSPAAPPPEAPPAAAPLAFGEDTADVQRVHIVEVRPFTEAGRWELSLFGPAQINAKFTEHLGVAAELAYHLRENLAAQLGLLWFPRAQQSGFTEQLIDKASQQPLAADALLLKMGALAGLELMPVYGKLDIFDGKILRLGFYLNASLGAGKMRLQLNHPAPGSAVTQRQFGDVGIRPMAALGAGFRVFLSEQVTVRLELRDLVYSAYVSRVNGCSFDDTRAIQIDGRAARVSGGCDVAAFAGAPTAADPAGDVKVNAAAAGDQIQKPSADVINNLTAYLGLSFLF
jgi:outer membrane beta-barrel protein